jgi:tRNA A37 threonylcarbamoyladenosine synthetase subunit TsaC/SUA5/YrdC
VEINRSSSRDPLNVSTWAYTPGGAVEVTGGRADPAYNETMPLLLGRSADVDAAVRHLITGAVVAVGFGNFYAVVSEPSVDAVRGLNRAKGRAADQVGSVTTDPSRIAAMFDWSRLSPRLDAARIRSLMDALFAAGPFGLRGPAAGHLPDHLTQLQHGVRTTQVIGPGSACPSNVFLDRAVTALGGTHLYVTSANRSRHLTGAAEEPAHWRATGVAADFAHLPDLTILAHADEAAARAAYPAHQPCSVTLLSFDAPAFDEPGAPDRPVLSVDRHGSLHIDDVRRAAHPLGLAVRLGPTAQRRLPVRGYQTAAV